jgi:hypothetical protein
MRTLTVEAVQPNGHFSPFHLAHGDASPNRRRGSHTCGVEPPASPAVLCRTCKHYRVSWDPRAPHSCSAIGFKSQKLPSLIVYESSGIECQLWEAKGPPPRPGVPSP